MKRIFVSTLIISLLAFTIKAHDLFLKLDSYMLTPNQKVTVSLMNGTFLESEGVVRRDRMQDVTLISPAGVTHPAAESFRDDDKTTQLDLQTGEAGTYVVAISTKTREIELKAADFNDYLKHDGIPDILAQRKKDKELEKDIKERYSKHVRAIFQVGNSFTEDYKKPLGYAVEIIPQQNPYKLKAGQMIDVLCTLDGKPLVNQYVLAASESNGKVSLEASYRTDKNGIAKVQLSSKGMWYVKFINMTPVKNAGDINYESKWATLTFEIK